MKISFDCKYVYVEPLGVRETNIFSHEKEEKTCLLCGEELKLSHNGTRFYYEESHVGILKIAKSTKDYVYVCPFCYHLNDYANRFMTWSKTGFHRYKFFLPSFLSLMLVGNLATEENNYRTLNDTNILTNTKQILWQEFLDIKSLEAKQNSELIKHILEQRFDICGYKVVNLSGKPLTFSDYCKMFFDSLFYQTIEEKEEANKDNKKNLNQEEGRDVNKSEFGNFKLISEI